MRSRLRSTCKAALAAGLPDALPSSFGSAQIFWHPESMKGISTIGPWMISVLALSGVAFQEWRYQQLERKLFAMREYTGRPNPIVQLAKLTARVDHLEAQQPPAPAAVPTAPAAPTAPPSQK